jgi:translation elongation factor EF-Tu-like GTPase
VGLEDARWRFRVSDAFRIAERGPAVIGHIESGRVRAGDVFEEDVEHPRRGMVLAVEGVRKAGDPDAVGLLVDVELRPGTVILQLRPQGER